MVLELIDEAQEAGARLKRACEILGIGVRTVQRWRLPLGEEDQRRGPKTDPPNKLSDAERRRVLDTLGSAKYRDLSPQQVVPRLADEGTYLASESTMYRLLREQDQIAHRDRSRPPSSRRPREHEATGPNQVWSWDITYLRSPVKGTFYYLYLFVDVWSRKIVGAEVFETECSDLAEQLFRRICAEEGLDPDGLVLHSDNGSPMKGATMTATLEWLGVVPSLSRPRVHDDNPYSESLFRTLKYRPEYPSGPFESLQQARAWVVSFVRWYNHEHLHSAIAFVTPADRHADRDRQILANRRDVYREAQQRHPKRFASGVRQWERPDVVYLNPEKKQTVDELDAA